MLVEAGERLAVLRDRLVVALVTGELLGVALAAGDVAGDARLVLVTAQVRTRVHHAARPRAVRRAVRLRNSSGRISTAR